LPFSSKAASGQSDATGPYTEIPIGPLVTGPSEVDQRPELRAAFNGSAGSLFLTDDFTPGIPQGFNLRSEVLSC
jgi:hypothetical protein